MTTTFVIAVVKIFCGLTELRLVSPQHFDHDNDIMTNVVVCKSTDQDKPLSIRYFPGAIIYQDF